MRRGVDDELVGAILGCRNALFRWASSNNLVSVYKIKKHRHATMHCIVLALGIFHEWCQIGTSAVKIIQIL